MSSSIESGSKARGSGPPTHDRLAKQTAAEWEPHGTSERQIGDFRILRELGRGGMGVVYEAEQVSLGRHVALKVLPFAAMLDDRQLVRFKTEAQAAARLHHPNIVPVFFVGCERGVHFYAMQYIDGQSLASAIRANRDLQQDGPPTPATDPPTSTHPATKHSLPAETTVLSGRGSSSRNHHLRVVAELVIQAAEALEHAHLSGIVHRDIKPGNLLLDADHKLWVTDFGLARVEQNPQVTMTGDVVGTIRYMSPEQASSGRGVDHRTDIYSLGVTLYESLTFRPPFKAANRQELLTKIATRDPVPPSRIDTQIPEELDAIVLKAMEKEPGSRYQSAEAFAEDLRCYLDNRPISARRPSLVAKTQKWMRRHPALIRSAVVILFLLAGVASLSAVLIKREQSQTVVALERAERNYELSETNRLQAEETSAQNETLLYTRGLGFAARARQVGDGTRAAESMRSNPAFSERTELRGIEWKILFDSLFTRHQTLAKDETEFTSTAFSGARHDFANAPARPSLDDRSKERYVAAGDAEGSIRIWRTDDQALAGVLYGHLGDVHSIAFHPDGNLIASAGEDGTVRIWDLRQKREIQRWDHSEERTPVMCVRFSRDASQLVSCGDDRVSRIWSLGEEIDLVHELVGHTRPVRTAAFSPDGTSIVTGSSDRRLIVWDIASGESVRQFVAHDGMVLSVCYSPSGRYMVSGGNDSIIRMWDALTGQQVAQIDGHFDGVQTLCMLPDESTIVAGDRSGQLRIWRASGKKVVDEFRAEHVHFDSVALSPDGGCWVGMRNNGQLYLRDLVMKRTTILESRSNWDPAAGRYQCIAFAGDGSLFFAADTVFKRDSDAPRRWSVHCKLDVPVGAAGCFSSDKRWLATAGDGKLTLWNPSDGSLVKARDTAAKIAGIRFAPTDHRLVVWSSDPQIEIWDADSESVSTFRLSGSYPTGIEWSPDGSQLAICTAEETVFVYDLERKELSQIDLKGVRCNAVDWVRDGEALVLGAPGTRDFIHWLDGSRQEIVGLNRSGRGFSLVNQSSQLLSHDYFDGVTVRDLDFIEYTSRPSDFLQGHTDRIWSIALSPRGDQLVSGSRDGTLGFRDLKSNDQWAWLTRRRHPHDCVADMAWSSSGEHLLLAQLHGFRTLRWPTGTPAHPDTDVVRPSTVRLGFSCEAIASGRAGELIATGHRDGQVNLWRANETEPLKSFQAFENLGVSTLRFSPDGKLLAAASRLDNRLRIWDVDSLEEIELLIADDCDDLCFSRDGKWLLFCDGREAVLWSVAEREVEQRFADHSITVHGVAFSTDGSMIATVCEDRKVRLWDPLTGKLEQTIAGHTDSIQRVAFSPDNRTLVTGDESGVVKLWNVKTGQELYTLADLGVWIHRIQFDPNESSLVILTDDGLVHHYLCGEMDQD